MAVSDVPDRERMLVAREGWFGESLAAYFRKNKKNIRFLSLIPATFNVFNTHREKSL